MAKILDWRALVYYETEKDGRGRFDGYIYKTHLDEAFSACIRFIREHHPDATLNFDGQDMGGPLYSVKEPGND